MTDRSRARAREDYIKAIYQMRRVAPVRSAELARRLGISRSSVSQFRHILEGEGLLDPGSARLDSLRLTQAGVQLAVRLVRRHRVIETFLHTSLHVPLERVHTEAERIEHVVSDDLVLRLAHLLGTPECDPHGHRIPYDDHDSNESPLRLSDVAVGGRVVVTSMDDRESDVVGLLADAHVLPGFEAVVRQTGPRVVLESLDETRTSIALPAKAAQAVRCATLAVGA